MNVRRLAGVVAILGIGAVLGHTAGSAQDKKDDKSLATRYAKAQLRLAELNLQKVQEMNKRVPGTLIQSVVQQFEEEVEFAKANVRHAEQNGVDLAYQSCLERAELGVRAAEAYAKRAEETHQRAPTMRSGTDVERAKVAMEMAQLQVERGKAASEAGFEAKCQWQLGLLGEELWKVRQQTALLGQNRFAQF